MQVFYSSFPLIFRSSETFYITQKKYPIFLPFFWHIHAHCTCTRIHSYRTIATHKTGSFRAILFCFAFSWNWCRCIRCMAYMKKIELSWAFVAYPIDFCRSNILLFFVFLALSLKIFRVLFCCRSFFLYIQLTINRYPIYPDATQ